MKNILPSILALLISLPAYATDLTTNGIIKKYAEQGDAEAQFVLAKMYGDGRGVAQSDDKAVQWMESAANGGLAQAQVRLANWHLNGRHGLLEDSEEAFEWYKLAANQEHEVAQFFVGNLLFKGDGVDQNRELGMQWMFRAADNNCRRAMVRLAQIYDRGIGVPVDDVEALKWYHKAVKFKLSYAQRALGRMYRTGEGTAINVAEAVKWYELAAKRGKTDAQFALAEIYLNGEGGIAVDQQRGMQWLQQAAKQNYKPAKALLSKLGQ